jgi:hypothetical protein
VDGKTYQFLGQADKEKEAEVTGIVPALQQSIDINATQTTKINRITIVEHLFVSPYNANAMLGQAFVVKQIS